MYSEAYVDASIRDLYGQVDQYPGMVIEVPRELAEAMNMGFDPNCPTPIEEVLDGQIGVNDDGVCVGLD